MNPKPICMVMNTFCPDLSRRGTPGSSECDDVTVAEAAEYGVFQEREFSLRWRGSLAALLCVIQGGIVSRCRLAFGEEKCSGKA